MILEANKWEFFHTLFFLSANGNILQDDKNQNSNDTSISSKFKN